MRIAIIGAGFAGLATAWKLLNHKKKPHVALFDAEESSASKTAAGLMHPFVGAAAKYNWRGNEGFQASKELLQEVQSFAAEPLFEQAGLLRVAVTEQQRQDFSHAAKQHEEITWLEAKEAREEILFPAIFIKKAITVYSDSYLEALLQGCKAKGVDYIKKKITALETLDSYDQIVVATGSATKALLPKLPLTLFKGQLLTYAWPQEMLPLPYPISSFAYIVMNKEQSACYVGSTYERHFANALPNKEEAVKLLYPKIEALLPALCKQSPIDCRAAVRATTPNRRPYCEKVNSKVWLFTGLGSKGLLYHALLAEELADAILSTN